MITRDKNFLGLALLFAFGTLVVAAAAQSSSQAEKKQSTLPKNSVATDARPALEPKAIDILKATSSRLAGSRTVAFTAVETYESPSRQGHPLVFVNKSEVTLQRPDKLRVIMPGDGSASEFYYDG